MKDKTSLKREALRSLDQAMLKEVLGERNVEKEVVAVYYDDFDRRMAEGEGERPWQSFELTQREDVSAWIEEPAKIQKIQPNLKDLRQLALSLPRPVTVLDVGCYGGYVYDYLSRYVFNDPSELSYLGVDVDPRVARAAAAIHEGSPNCRFEEGDLYNLSEAYAENSFDIVLCSRVLIHVSHYEKAIAELFRVSRKAVIAVLEVAPRAELQRIHRKNLDTGVELDYFFRKYTSDELISVARSLGAEWRIVQGESIYSSYLLYKAGDDSEPGTR